MKKYNLPTVIVVFIPSLSDTSLTTCWKLDEFSLTGTHIQRTRTSSSEFYKGLTEVITGKRLSDIKPITNDAILRIVLPIFHELKLRKFAGMVKYFVFQFVEVFEVPGCWVACTMATDIVQLYGFASVSFFISNTHQGNSLTLNP
jgi:hypothetical protein